MKEICGSLLVYNSTYQSNCRLLLLMVIGTILTVCLGGVLASEFLLLMIPLLFVTAELSAFVLIKKDGLVVYRFLHKPIRFPWNRVVHYGNVEKSKRFRCARYIYFSTVPLITAPSEPMPAISNTLVYFSYQPRIRSILRQCWDLQKVNAIFPNEQGKRTAARRNMLHIYLIFYFVFLFGILHKLTNNDKWIYMMIIPIIYVAIDVLFMLCNKTKDGT